MANLFDYFFILILFLMVLGPWIRIKLHSFSGIPRLGALLFLFLRQGREIFFNSSHSDISTVIVVALPITFVSVALSELAKETDNKRIQSISSKLFLLGPLLGLSVFNFSSIDYLFIWELSFWIIGLLSLEKLKLITKDNLWLIVTGIMFILLESIAPGEVVELKRVFQVLGCYFIGKSLVGLIENIKKGTFHSV